MRGDYLIRVVPESVSMKAETVQFPMLRHATKIGWTPL